MKLQKLKISELSNYRHLTHQEMRQYVGGYDTTTDTSCFFNCMEYFWREVCGNENGDNYSTFGNAYINGVGDYKGTMNPFDFLDGPEAYEKDGSINPKLFEFFSHYFNTDASGWTTGSDIASLLATTGSEENTAIMGYFDTGKITASGARIAHCVILKKYDAATDTYTYYDPSCSGTEEEKTKIVSGSRMLFAGKGGCK